jgi:hypothetical protein
MPAGEYRRVVISNLTFLKSKVIKARFREYPLVDSSLDLAELSLQVLMEQASDGSYLAEMVLVTIAEAARWRLEKSIRLHPLVAREAGPAA